MSVRLGNSIYEINRGWANHAKSKTISDNRTPFSLLNIDVITSFAPLVRSLIFKLISDTSFSIISICFFTANSLIGILAILSSKIDAIVPMLLKKNSSFSSVTATVSLFGVCINNPISIIKLLNDTPGWGMRTVHLRDPEENLIEFFTPLPREQYSLELLEEDKKFQ